MARRGGRALLIPILAVLVQAPAPAPAEDLFAVVERAGKGHADAQFRMGLIYFEGDIVSKDARQAAGWFRKAAEQGHAHGQYNLALKYLLGEGVAKDLRATASWYRKAAEQGDTLAQINLGALYANGNGVERDDARAYAWTGLAAGQGNETAKRNRTMLRQTMTTGDLLGGWALTVRLRGQIRERTAAR